MSYPPSQTSQELAVILLLQPLKHLDYRCELSHLANFFIYMFICMWVHMYVQVHMYV